MLLEFGYWILIGGITFLLNIPIINLFLKNPNNNIINISSNYLVLMSLFYLWPAMTNGIQGIFRALGHFKITVLGTFIQAGIRTIMAYILTPILGISGIAYSCVIGWSMMLLVQIPILSKKINTLS